MTCSANLLSLSLSFCHSAFSSVKNYCNLTGDGWYVLGSVSLVSVLALLFEAIDPYLFGVVGLSYSLVITRSLYCSALL